MRRGRHDRSDEPRAGACENRPCLAAGSVGGAPDEVDCIETRGARKKAPEEHRAEAELETIAVTNHPLHRRARPRRAMLDQGTVASSSALSPVPLLVAVLDQASAAA